MAENTGEVKMTPTLGLTGLTMNAMELESPFCPVPWAGLRVLTNAVPGLAISAAVTVPVIPVTFPALSIWTCVAMVFPFH